LNAHTIETTEGELQSVFNSNLFSVVALTREFLPLLKKSRVGRIVNLGSILGSLTLQSMPGSPITPFKAFAYNASKTALNQFTVHLAAELESTNIKVNSAHPGWVKTELGTQHAQMEIVDGAKTSVELALIGPDGSQRKVHSPRERAALVIGLEQSIGLGEMRTQAHCAGSEANSPLFTCSTLNRLCSP
jgi:NAD(P)-dependent dehydrogenase (short-subunit alcohol dehydrogenase family)